MPVSNPFDNIAVSYDKNFTFSAVGKAQRKLVRSYLKRHVDKSKKLNILELNCGTGEDAIWLARFGHKVVATDVSPKMIEIAENKICGSHELALNFAVMDIKEIEKYEFDNKFDLVFSNFGGLNCLDSDELFNLNERIAKLLVPNGIFIGVLMSDFCAFESLYFTLKGKWKEVFRRKQNLAVLLSAGDYQPTFYYSPGEYLSFFSSEFKRIDLKPIGLFIPPSYLNNFFATKKNSLKFFTFLDHKIFSGKIFANFADHFYVEMLNKK